VDWADVRVAGRAVFAGNESKCIGVHAIETSGAI
jgi:hypothetical protein